MLFSFHGDFFSNISDTFFLYYNNYNSHFLKLGFFSVTETQLVQKVHELSSFLSIYIKVSDYANFVYREFSTTQLMRERCLYNATFSVHVVAIRPFQRPV